MITVIAKNQTVGDLALNTLSVADRIIPGSGQVTLTDFNNIFQIIANDELEAYVDSDDVLLNVNGVDLNKTKSKGFLNLELGAAITTSLSGLISLDGVVGPVDFNTDQHNFTATGLDSGNFLWLNPTSPNKKITGIVAPAAGINQVLFILNTNTSNKLTLNNNDANSLAANRFMFKNNIDLDNANGAVLVYSHTDQRWKCLAVNTL